MNRTVQNSLGRGRRSLARANRGSAAFGLLAACMLAFFSLALFASFDWFAVIHHDFTTVPVSLGRLPLTIDATGTLQCQVSTEIKCDVYSFSPNNGTQILYLVPDGTHVRKGDLLVQLDPSLVKDRLETYEHYQIRYEARQHESQARLENQKLTNKTRLAEAQQAVELAQLTLQAYENSTHQIARDKLTSQIEAARGQVKLTQTELELMQEKLSGIKGLKEAGYRGQAHVDLAQLECLRAASKLDAAKHTLSHALARLRKFDRFEHPITQRQLQAQLSTVQTKLQQVTMQNQWVLIEREADLQERNETVATNNDRIQLYSTQVENCRIYAPHDGIVVYQKDRYGNTPGEGSLVARQETILTIANTTRMQVKTIVNEAEYRHLEPGQTADVRVQAFLDRSYSGTVQSVAALPSPAGRYTDDVQVFEVVITIDEPVQELRPGMTGVVQINVQSEQDVLQIPVEAVVVNEGKLCVYVDSTKGPRPRRISIGDSNEQMVEVRRGLGLDDHVLLSRNSLE